jgi:hypothetical protein
MDSFLKKILSNYFGTDSEGRSVFWPFGRGGAGYLIDKETEKNLVRRLALTLVGGLVLPIWVFATGAPFGAEADLMSSPTVRWFFVVIIAANVAFFVQGYAASRKLKRV